LKLLQAKMQEFLDSGLQLGWLINPQDQAVEIYRVGQEVEVVQMPTLLLGETALPEFTVDVS